MNRKVVFEIPTPSAFCCNECSVAGREVKKGNSYPMVSMQDSDEAAGGKTVTIRHDCGKESTWSILYFRSPR